MPLRQLPSFKSQEYSETFQVGIVQGKSRQETYERVAIQ